MRKLRHVLSGATYESHEPGLIRVDHNGVVGIFREDGSWVSGELRSADQHMCNWVGGRAESKGFARADKVRHFSGALYEREEPGVVRVEQYGMVGRFRTDGTWVSGELKNADPNMCQWIGGYTQDADPAASANEIENS